MRRVVALLLGVSQLFGNIATTENEPSSLVDGIVSAITGDLYLAEEDIVVQGYEPIRLKRSYITSEGQWMFFDHLRAIVVVGGVLPEPTFPNHIWITEPNGTSMVYYYTEFKELLRYQRGKRKSSPPFRSLLHTIGLTNAGRGKISARDNLRNQYATFNEKGQLVVHCPDETKKIFVANPYQPYRISNDYYKPDSEVSYLLFEEELPNGNKIRYEWSKNEDEDNQLLRIISLSPQEVQFASAEFSYNSTGFSVITSDGRTLAYKYTSDHKSRRYLSLVSSSDRPNQYIHCIKRDFFKKGKDKHDEEIDIKIKTRYLIDHIELPEGRSIRITYHDDGHNRIKTLKTPVSEGRELYDTRTFLYEDNKCTVWDVNGVPTYYHWDKKSRLTRIEEPNCIKTFNWDDSGTLLSKAILDKNERVIYTTHYRYDECGNIVEERIESDQVYTKCYTYSANNLLLSQTEDSGLAITYEYLPGTNLPTKMQTGGRTTTYEYDSDHILMQIVEEGSGQRRIQRFIPNRERPYAGLPKTILELYGNDEKLLKRYDLHYTTGGRISQKDVYDAENHLRYSLTYKYDEKGRLIEETNALGQVAKSRYDVNGNKIEYLDFGGVVSKMAYDYSNRLTRVEKEGHVTQNSYDKRHNKNKTIDAHGYETRYAYDAADNLIEECPSGRVIHYSYDALGYRTSHIDARGHATHTTYNVYGKPTHIKHPDNTQERFTYNADGTLRSHVDQAGVETIYTHDMYGRMTSKRRGDAEERWIYGAYNLLAYIDAEGHRNDYAYDAAGRKMAEILGGEKKEYGYDALGRLHSSKEDDRLATTEYDLLDRVVEERRGDVSSRYAYDARGNKSIIAKGESRETFAYDLFNRLTQKVDGCGNTTRISYDDRAHQKTTVDSLGLKTVETFNCHYALAALDKYAPDGVLLFHEEYTYDGNDNLIQRKNPHTVVVWEYDPMNRVSLLSEAGQKITRYTYTPRGELKTLTKPGGAVLSYSYDIHGNLSELTAPDIHYLCTHDRCGMLIQSLNQLTGEKIQRTYDPHGRLISEDLNGIVVKNTYNTKGDRTQCKFADRVIQYEYDPYHLRKVSFGDVEHRYTRYDSAGNLTEEETPYGTVTRTYDPANYPIAIKAPYFSHHVTYDAVHNVTHATLHGEEISYTYDPLYQITSEKNHRYQYDPYFNRTAKDGKPLEVNALDQLPTEFTYDPNGNPISDGKLIYTYDSLDRLVRVNDTTYTYDFLNRRLTRTQNHQITHFLYDDQNEIGLLQDTTLLELRILGGAPHAEISSAIALLLNGTIYTPFHDLYGNLAKVVSKSRIEEYRYSVFGESTDGDEEAISPWRFSSKRVDVESGLVYFGRRYYSPKHGRWLTPDPLGFKGGSNLYAYVSNAPLTHFDAYGLLEMVPSRFFMVEPGYSNQFYQSAANTFFDPRFQGGLQAAGGLMEAAIGASLTMSGIGTPLGLFLTAHGLDHYSTGMNAVFSGSQRDSSTSQLLQAVGMSSQNSQLYDGGISLLASGGAALFARSNLMRTIFAGVTPRLSLLSVATQTSTAIDFVPGAACNRGLFEKGYLRLLRRQMEKPHAADLRLQKILNETYRENATIGSGSTAAAIRRELETGLPVKGKMHFHKGRDKIRELQNWLRSNPSASSGDRAAAENVIKDMLDALGE